MTDQQTFYKILNTNATQDDSLGFVQKLANQYPYFGLAQFYKLKLSKTEGGDYQNTTAKTSLFFNNNFYLQSRLKKSVSITNDTVQDQKEKGITAEQTTSEQPAEKEEMLFEPLHASDYFASQGIKLSEDALGADKLGKQLKSFTSWLKTMKKVHGDKLPAVNTITENAVQLQAEKSNVSEDILTEPMAEAYILQNKTLKAIEIYNKLSLINPAKSAYFAAKIDSLKN